MTEKDIYFLQELQGKITRTESALKGMENAMLRGGDFPGCVKYVNYGNGTQNSSSVSLVDYAPEIMHQVHDLVISKIRENLTNMRKQRDELLLCKAQTSRKLVEVKLT